MSDLTEELKDKLEAIALEVVTMEATDIPAMGNILNCLGELEENSEEIGALAFLNVTRAAKAYLEKVILREQDDLGPLGEGIDCLQSICRHMVNQEEFKGDTSPILNKLNPQRALPEGGEKEELCEPGDVKTQRAEEAKPSDEKARDDEADGAMGEGDTYTESPDEELSDEDREIVADFVLEALENLDSVEVGLIDLEHNPDDMECINTIFRPFHTIKGVSGFLNLKKINKLAHSAENLLDKARNGEIRVEGTIVDIILESVDMLKKLVEGVQEGLESGVSFDSRLDITPLITRIKAIESEADQIGDKPLGEILVQKGTIARDDLQKALHRQKREPDRKIGKILVGEARADSKDVISALRDQKKFNRRHFDLQVKVDTEKLDSLVDLTGELVIAQSMLRQNNWVVSSKDQNLYHNLNQLAQITSGLQTTAMSMRMVPIKNTFQKMVRLVRDLSKNSGKEVRLEMSGEDTEIDRNVVEELYEPMVHMIRNAVDHGLESPEERKEAGKERTGKISLRAYHQGGNIIVEIQDDGRGLDKDRIREKAKSKDLIADDSRLSDSEIYNLIFHPGFSTAKVVTDVSGRGVGMDVVKKAIEKLRGRVEINSRPSHGSTFVISLPLTLAIIEGMLVRVGEERYIIPALAILESFRPDKSQYFTVEGRGEIIESRGDLMPLIRLDHLFDVEGDSAKPWESLVVAVEHEGEKMCLLLDELLGKEEVVIKSLGESLQNLRGIAGGAIMGDGRVGLIFDIAGIFEISRNG
ncbi:MAG: chemotaxis protein CheA [Thermodesulfobacteriota bacterium]|nr:chemotaxis protein CheA [Thermodesulfobacteriota bacterium]